MQRQFEFKGRVTRPDFNQQQGHFFTACEPHPFQVVQPHCDIVPEGTGKKVNGDDDDTAQCKEHG
jgi:hypothetical protein